jgi:carboxymethylenebutenolidase
MAGTYVEIEISGSGRMSAYVVRAGGNERRTGLLVLQEIFGVNTNMRHSAEAFAESGYDVIVPDLFWRQAARVELDPATDHARAVALMQGLDLARAVDDALAAAEFLRQSETSSGQTVAVGYCLGGKLAFLLAARTRIAAVASYYGVGIEQCLDRADELQTPLLLHIGMADALCPPASQAAIHVAMDSRADVEIIDHPGAGHAFARRGGATFNRDAAERADAATLAFFARHLDARES